MNHTVQSTTYTYSNPVPTTGGKAFFMTDWNYGVDSAIALSVSLLSAVTLLAVAF